MDFGAQQTMEPTERARAIESTMQLIVCLGHATAAMAIDAQRACANVSLDESIWRRQSGTQRREAAVLNVLGSVAGRIHLSKLDSALFPLARDPGVPTN